MKRVVVVGSGGQDGRLLYDRLEKEGAWVLGVERHSLRCTETLGADPVDVQSVSDVRRAIELARPDEVYYLAAYHQSAEERPPNDRVAFQESFAVNTSGLLNFLHCLQEFQPTGRLFYAASCHVFGQGSASPMNEETPFAPDTPYAITKAAGLASCRYYRERHSLFAVSGLLFNHESPLRGPSFLSQKIVRAAVDIRAGNRSELILGDLQARVDWGYAPDTVEAMTRILALDTPDDFVVATGELHSVEDFLDVAFGALDLDWRGYVREDPNLVSRQALPRLGDASKLRRATGWAPSVSFDEMVRSLVDARACEQAE
jgi:GDPmannose 4,6-dehydratase